MKRKNRGKGNKKARGAGKQSLMTPVPLDKVKPEQRKSAEDVFRFIRSNPECTRQNIVSAIPWATNDNVRMPLRILFTEKRIAVKELTDYKWKFYAVNKEVAWSNRMLSEGKIEARKCGGKNQKGEACRAPDIFVRENGYCMHHGPDADEMKAKCEATRISNQESKMDDKNLLMSTPKDEKESIGLIVDTLDLDTCEDERVYDVDISKLTPINDGWITLRLRVPTAKTDNTLRDIVKAFLNGNANIIDLREAVKDE